MVILTRLDNSFNIEHIIPSKEPFFFNYLQFGITIWSNTLSRVSH
jgi:hypothetical protein